MEAMDNKPLVLIVEDENTVSNFMGSMLTSNGYRFIRSKTGKEAVEMIKSHMPDLILLDLGLPDIDGLFLLEKIRSWSNIPIIIVSARGDERDKVKGLDLGADDYITKPFGTAELLARIRTAIRHSFRISNNNVDNIFESGDLKIDYDKRIVTLKGEVLHVTPIEYKILVLMSQNAGKVLTHDAIIKEVWGPYTNENQTLRVNMANIRRKLESNPAEPRYILTEVGVGYRMSE
jgi:two-component system KDP operon response regulator KdpE